MELHDIQGVNDPYLSPVDKELKYGGAFITDFNLIRRGSYSLFSNNKLEFQQSRVTGKVRSGGWTFQLGGEMKLSDNSAIAIGKWHRSFHIFEEGRDKHFPTFDSYYIDLIIYRK